MKGVQLTKMAQELELTNLTPELDLSEILIKTAEINRPALQLTGYLEHFANERVQIIGYVEFTYLMQLSDAERLFKYERFISSKIPCVIFSTMTRPSQDMIDLALKYKVPIFVTDRTTSSFMAEIIRSALQSVDPGQIEAAHALGMTYPQTLRRIILPEAFEVALPTLGNSFISIIKGTSLAFTCAVVEITAQGQIIGGRTYRYFEVYVSLAIIYWLVTLVIEQIIRVIENKIRIPDQVELASANGEGKKNDKN